MDANQLRQLAHELAAELDEFQKIKALIAETQTRFDSHTPDTLELYIPGGVLHDLYHGVEGIFSHIAKQIDQHVPSGANWHRELIGPL